MELPDSDGDDAVVAEEEATWTVVRIVRSWLRHNGERKYEIKWEGWGKEHNTHEPEAHLLTCKLLVPFWKAKKNKVQIDRVTKLKEAALQELANAEESRRRPRVQMIEQSAELAPCDRVRAATVPGLHEAPAQRPAAGATQSCTGAHDSAHRALATARSLVFNTKTSRTAGCVLSLGWVLVDANGSELA